MKRTKSPAKQQDRMSRLLDELVEFEEFRTTILDTIRQDLKSGMTAAQLREKYSALVQARVLTEALTDESARALTAAKDVLDRAHGKATEKKEITHTLKDMSEEELDALIRSEEEELREIEVMAGEH